MIIYVKLPSMFNINRDQLLGSIGNVSNAIIRLFLFENILKILYIFSELYAYLNSV